MEGFLVTLIACAILGAFVADRRGGSRLAGSALGLFLGPLGVLIAFVIGGKICPACRSRIHREATRCPKCQEAMA